MTPLHYEQYSKKLNKTPLIVLHGLFGALDNWKTLCRQWAESIPVIGIDLRNHGQSPHLETMSYEEMANDVFETLDNLGISNPIYILGHSMGGKVAMSMAQMHPDRLKGLIVVDIAPKAYAPHHNDVFEGLNAVNLDTIQSRSEADQMMSSAIEDKMLRGFLLKNLKKEAVGFKWQFNLIALCDKYSDIMAPPVLNESVLMNTLFIDGGASDYITEDDHQLIKDWFPNAEIATISGAGHWVHAQSPDQVLTLVQEFCHE